MTNFNVVGDERLDAVERIVKEKLRTLPDMAEMVGLLHAHGSVNGAIHAANYGAAYGSLESLSKYMELEIFAGRYDRRARQAVTRIVAAIQLTERVLNHILSDTAIGRFEGGRFYPSM